ncbi:hypothetical protein DYB37_002617 [Aphanomyces astaci]|uniref:Uncharacterized protein n=1 Tax=Aphanomyces astaci TaxID=112090 RepID=A0A3R6ZXG7_APHAT|nr:hypothetical protein DYB35_002972 [Aphanomyces astaci]RHZ03469.1 hypothetical protein DYB37_002617 [Aphanomyces astaci]
MNGVLSSVTWGTWDLESPTYVTRNGEDDDFASAQGSKKERRRREKGVPRLQTQEMAWFNQLLHDKIEPLKVLHYLPNPLAATTMTSVIPWDDLPLGIHPKDGHLPPQRIQNKRHQVDNLAVFLRRLLRRNQSKGYATAMFIMHPVAATPKNDILVGWPASLAHMEAPGQFLTDRAVHCALYGHELPRALS